MKLTAQRLAQARAFINDHARPVDKVLFAYHWGAGTATAVLQALAAYQNDDGGMGHALEPDFRLAASSPMATSVGLQYAVAVDAPASHPLVADAIRYLLATYDREHQYWPATYENVNDAPHAFWWHVDQISPPDETGWPNPSAELTGYLHRYAELVPPALLQEVTARAQANLASSDIISGDAPQRYNLLCWERALPHLPHPLQTEARTKIKHTFDRWRPFSGEALDELSVVAFVTPPLGLLAEMFPAEVNRLLDAEIEAQAEDGGWRPGWHWGQYEEVWPVAEREWAGKITAETVLALRRFGKIEGISSGEKTP